MRLLGLPAQELTPKVRSALGQLIDEVAELRHELLTTQRRLMELERLADEDSLAPISNRRAFLRHLARTITYVERYGATCSLLYFDVNGLKTINDTHGHAAGDAALIYVADVLRGNTRTSDVVGRLGGDEFGVVLTRANEVIATNKAHQLARVVAASQFTWDGRTVPISVAFGAHGLRQARTRRKRWPQPIAPCTDKSERAAPWRRACRQRFAQAMMSGRRSLSRRAIRSLSASFCFFRRCTSSWSGKPCSTSWLIRSSRARCAARSSAIFRSISRSGDSVIGDHPEFDHLGRNCRQHDTIIMANRTLTKHNQPPIWSGTASGPQGELDCASAC